MLRYLNHPVLNYRLLYLNRHRIGLLRFIEPDVPWMVWAFRPTAHFTPLRPLFDREAALAVPGPDNDWQRSVRLILRLPLRMVWLDGRRIYEWRGFFIRIDGQRAMTRGGGKQIDYDFSSGH